MAKPKDITKAETPSRKETGAETLIRLGSLLHRLAFGGRGEYGVWCPLQQPEQGRVKAEIGQAENDLIGLAAEDRSLRSALETRRDEVVDRLAMRLVAYVAYHAMAIEPPGVSVTKLTKVAAMDNHADLLKVRHLLRSLIIRENALKYCDEDSFCGGSVLPGRALVRYVSGANGLEVYWDSKSIEAEKARFARLYPGVKAASETAPAACIPKTATQPTVQKPLGVPETPKAIFNALRQTVIGMDDTVRRFSVQMSLHMRRVALVKQGIRPTTPPVTVLCVGDSGVGKTFVVEEFCKMAGLPFTVGNLAECTASGFVGINLSDVLASLFRGGEKREQVEAGAIVFWDEADKRRCNDRRGDFDATGSGVQAELLRILSGTEIQLGGRRANDGSGRCMLSTHGMAHCLAGCFPELQSIMLQKSCRRSIGFGDGNADRRHAPDIREALASYFLPELCNRVSTILYIRPPSLEQLMEIATAPCGVLARQNQFLASMGLTLKPSEAAIREICGHALDAKTYARGVRSMLQAVVEDAVFEEMTGEIVIGVEQVRRVIEGDRQGSQGADG